MVEATGATIGMINIYNWGNPMGGMISGTLADFMNPNSIQNYELTGGEVGYGTDQIPGELSNPSIWAQARSMPQIQTGYTAAYALQQGALNGEAGTYDFGGAIFKDGKLNMDFINGTGAYAPPPATPTLSK